MAVKKGKEVMTPGSSSSKAAAGVKRKKIMASKGEGSGKKLRRADVLRFIDNTAEIAEDDGDSDGLSFIDDLGDNDDEDNDGGFVNELKPGLKDAKSSGGRSHHLNFFLKEEDLTVEEHDRLIKEQYSRHVNYKEVTKQTDEIFFPSSKDLDIWRVKCMVGREQQITTSIFQKFVDLHTFGTKMPIVSVFALDHAKGCIFVEAEKEADVTEACKGFCNLYSTRKTLVTKDEFPRLLSIKSISNGLSKGTWVRVKNGNYKGDLAQVVAVDDQHKRVMLKLIPRVDLQALAKKFGGGVSLKESGIPAPRLISSRELEDFRPHVQLKRDRLTGEHFEILDGLMLKEGYLYKKVSLASISWSGIQPTKNELLKFEAAKVNDAEDLNWLSLVYGDRKKVQQEPEHGAENNRGSGYEVHDLVLFGRKDFGVIIGVKGESIQILKGDTEEQKLATVLRKEIKNVCADKMFTASDRHMKTICISDCVKVFEGPLEGREGTVKHMYKGFLFVYDETQSENCGYICVKSQLCTNTRKSKYSKSGAKSDKAGCSSSYMDAGESMDTEATDTRESDFKDSDDNARRPRWMNTDSPFSTGQTVRIRVGPLKGYICRVVSIYRSKVTVKLDSLVKIMTVNSNDLSEVAVKNVDDYMRTTSTLTSFNQFEFKDGSSGDGSGAPSQKSSWDLDVPDTARDSWPGFSTSELSVPVDGDSKGGIDMWNSKLDPKNETSSTLGCWDKGGNSSEDQNSSWNSGSGDSGVSKKEQTDIWEKNASGTDMWNSKQKITNDDLSNGMDCWDKGTNSTGGQNSAWNNSSGHQIGIGTNKQATWEKNAGSWKQNAGDVGSEAWGKDKSSQNDGKQQSPSGDAKDNWEKKASNTHTDSWNAREKCASSSRTAGLAGEESNWNQQSSWNSSRADCKEKADPWDSKRKCIIGNDNGWGKPAVFERKTSTTGDDGQAGGKACRVTNLSSSNANKTDTWDFKCKAIDGNENDAWSKLSCSPRMGGGGGENESWGKTSAASSRNSTSVGCKEDLQQNNVEYGAKLSETHHEQSDRWDKATTLPSVDQSDDWGKSKGKSTQVAPQGGTWDSASEKQELPSSGDWSQLGSWEKSKLSSEGFSDTWNKHNSAGEHDTGGWKKGTLNDGGADRWSKPEPPNNDWQQNRADANCYERGRGFGRGRGRGRGYNSRGSSQGSNWGSGRGQSGDRNRYEQSDGTTWTGKSCDKWERKGRDDWNSNSWDDNLLDSGGKSNSFGRGGGSATWNRNQGSEWNSMGKHIDEGSSKFDKPCWNNGGRNWNDLSSTSASQSGWGQASAADESVGGEAKWDVPKPSENPSSWNDDGDAWNIHEKRSSDQSKSWNDKSTKSNFESATKGVWDKDNSSADGKWGNPVDGISSSSANISTKLNESGISLEKAKFSGEKQSSCWNAEEGVAETQNMSGGYGWDQPVKIDSGNTETKNDGWNVAKQSPQDESSPWDSSHATGSGRDRPKAHSSAKDSKWNENECKNWSKGSDDDGNRSSSWNRSCGYDSGGHGSHRGGRSGNWSRGGWSNGGGGRGRNFNSDMGGTRKPYGSWNDGKNFGEEQSTARGSSSLSGGWSTEKGILESPKPKPDWGSRGWGQSSFSSGKASGDDDTDKGSMGPPRSDGKWYSTSGSEKGSEGWGNARDRNSGEKQNVKGDCSNWNRTTGNDSWSRENAQPTGLEAVGNEGNAWGKVSGGWGKAVDGNSGERQNERGDSSNFKRNSGRDSWGQEKPQSFGLEASSENETSPWGKGSGSSQAKDENSSHRQNDGGDSSTWNRNAEGASWGQEKSRSSGKEAPGNEANDWGNGSVSSEKGNSSESRNNTDDSSNWNKNTGTDSWGQEKSQPSGSEPVRDGGNTWENSGGSWNKGKNQQSSGKGGW